MGDDFTVYVKTRVENALGAMGCSSPNAHATLMAEILPAILEDWTMRTSSRATGGVSVASDRTLWRRDWGPVSVVRFTGGFTIQLMLRRRGVRRVGKW